MFFDLLEDWRLLSVFLIKSFHSSPMAIEVNKTTGNQMSTGNLQSGIVPVPVSQRITSRPYDCRLSQIPIAATAAAADALGNASVAQWKMSSNLSQHTSSTAPNRPRWKTLCSLFRPVASLLITGGGSFSSDLEGLSKELTLFYSNWLTYFIVHVTLTNPNYRLSITVENFVCCAMAVQWYNPSQRNCSVALTTLTL